MNARDTWTRNEPAIRIPVPTLPGSHPFLTFAPARSEEIRAKLDSCLWARMGYNQAKVLADTVWTPTPSGEDDDWSIPAASQTAFRGRTLFFAAYAAALLGSVEGDRSYLARAAQLVNKALDGAMEKEPPLWWQPVALELVSAADAVIPILGEAEAVALKESIRHALADARAYGKKQNNIGMGHRTAMAAVGALTGDRDLVDLALNEPECGAVSQILNLIQEDGFWNEPGTGYHHYALSLILRLFWICDMIGIDLITALGDRVGRACRASFGLLDSRLRYPLVGDTFAEGIAEESPNPGYPIRTDRSILELGLRFFKDPWLGWALRHTPRDTMGSLVWGVGTVPSEAPPADSIACESHGIVALRAGDMSDFWGSDGLTAFLRTGTHGVAHNHPDSLGLELRAYGCEMVADRGRALRYANLIHPAWHKKTLAHSTVIVDRKDQTAEQRGRLLSFHASPRASAACASCATAYRGVQYRRRIILTDRYLIDDFSVSAKRPRLYHYVLHSVGQYSAPYEMHPIESLGLGDGYEFLCNLRGIDMTTCWQATLHQVDKYSNPTTGMQVQALRAMPGRMILASVPAAGSKGFEECLIFECERSEARFLNVLAPFADEKTAPIIDAITHPVGDDACCVTIRFNDCEDLICCLPDGGTYEAGSVRFEGQFLFLRRDREGVVLRVVGRHACFLSIDGKTELQECRPRDVDL